MGTSALFSALNSLPLDEDEDGGDASEDDDYEGYSSEENAPQARAATQRPTRPNGRFFIWLQNHRANVQRNAWVLLSPRSDPCPHRSMKTWFISTHRMLLAYGQIPNPSTSPSEPTLSLEELDLQQPPRYNISSQKRLLGKPTLYP
jgi:hypothetical protein